MAVERSMGGISVRLPARSWIGEPQAPVQLLPHRLKHREDSNIHQDHASDKSLRDGLSPEYGRHLGDVGNDGTTKSPPKRALSKRIVTPLCEAPQCVRQPGLLFDFAHP